MSKENTTTSPAADVLKEKFEDLVLHLRDEVKKTNDPQAKALFEVSAEVLNGLKKAFTDYQEKKEAAWQS